jgi:hypothetical protein
MLSIKRIENRPEQGRCVRSCSASSTRPSCLVSPTASHGAPLDFRCLKQINNTAPRTNTARILAGGSRKCVYDKQCKKHTAHSISHSWADVLRTVARRVASSSRYCNADCKQEIFNKAPKTKPKRELAVTSYGRSTRSKRAQQRIDDRRIGLRTNDDRNETNGNDRGESESGRQRRRRRTGCASGSSHAAARTIRRQRARIMMLWMIIMIIMMTEIRHGCMCNVPGPSRCDALSNMARCAARLWQVRESNASTSHPIAPSPALPHRRRTAVGVRCHMCVREDLRR